MAEIAEIKEMQQCILGIMKAIDKVCRDHNLTYYMIAGTQLGAVRHKGFIPWDDDADFALPRKDYEVLIAHANEWLPEHYRLVDGTKDSKYPYLFARVQDMRTTYLLYRHFDFLGGVPVDIFPLDGMVEEGMCRKWHYFKYDFNVRLFYFLTVDPMKHGKNLRYYFLKLLRKMVDSRKVFNRLNAIQKEFDYEKSPFVADHDNAPERGILPKDVYGAPKEYQFEDTKFYGVADSHAYLSYCYGDYSTPKEAPHPNFRILDLHKSYLDTKNN